MKKRRGPYARNPQLKRKASVHVRIKDEVLKFLKVGGDYHGVGHGTYLQWLLERSLLEEIHYYGWDALHPLTFDRNPPRKEDERREFVRLDRMARYRAMRDDKKKDASDTETKPASDLHQAMRQLKTK